MKQIVCLSTSPWFPIPTRKQQVMSRIPNSDILYFDPPVSFLAPLKDRAAIKKLTAWMKKGDRVLPHITVYTLPPTIPFANRFRWINKINQHFASKYIQKKMNYHGMKMPVLWVYSPVHVDCVEHIPHQSLIYDCVDRHSAYGGWLNPCLVDDMEGELAEKCDLVFATAKRLLFRLKKFNTSATMIPNGADYERFRMAAEKMPCPDDMKNISGPIFGFVGALQPCIEYGYIECAAKMHPEWNFVFIGREFPGSDIKALHNLSNCFFLGLKANDILPSYISQFHVCLNLFAANDLSKDVSPLKFYEYLSTGKPIVSTPQPDQVLQYASMIHIANDALDFVRCCVEALEETDDQKRQERMDEGKKSCWDSRVLQMMKVIEEKKVIREY